MLNWLVVKDQTKRSPRGRNPETKSPMEVTTKGKKSTVQGFGSPVLASVEGEKAGPGTSSSKYRNDNYEMPSAATEKFPKNSRYFVIKPKDGNFDSVSPFLIERVLSSTIGKAKNINKCRDGLMVEVHTAAQAGKLCKMKKFDNFPVAVTPHSTLNFSRGQVTSRDLLNCSTEEILQNLSSQGVTDVRRRTFMRNGNRENTSTLILTFDTPELPRRVTAGYLSLPVTTWIPPPLRCYRCQRFGHTSTTCKSTEMCACGREPHNEEPCQELQQCINCSGPHSARSNQCPAYKEEVAIQRIKVTERITYREARNKVRESTRAYPTVSYATAAAKRPSAQSDINIQEVITALIPELTRIVRETLSTSLLLGHSQESISPKVSKPLQTLKNDTPTSVLRQLAKNSAMQSDPKKLQFESTKVTEWFAQNDKQRRSREHRKRTSDQASTPAMSITSVGDDNPEIENSDSSSGTKPPKKKIERVDQESKPDESLSEDDSENIFETDLQNTTPLSQTRSKERKT